MRRYIAVVGPLSRYHYPVLLNSVIFGCSFKRHTKACAWIRYVNNIFAVKMITFTILAQYITPRRSPLLLPHPELDRFALMFGFGEGTQDVVTIWKPLLGAGSVHFAI